MRTSETRCTFTLLATLSLLCFGCDEPAATSSATSATATSTATAEAVPPPTATASASAVEEEAKPSHPCPEGSEGEGTRKDPCVASGTARIMEVTWMNKITDKGPKFRVKSKAKVPILYGDVRVYFYDAAGKRAQLETRLVKGEVAKLASRVTAVESDLGGRAAKLASRVTAVERRKQRPPGRPPKSAHTDGVLTPHTWFPFGG